ncbi:hypothetical protein CW751_05295 [Brumimicrobium salinarum]|uniref:Outer membrane protein beta-barrel domain-containing protein n=1 Tax=Brumimicrobium salinarum TaxID=2058658 RepID=A0A2I0R528_9FLAO|nr:hypothetical protein [Brumimicrobium salinarum]PKR81470.1 hypothetical protein CW751_05295 [Brumimicrobium salinarum]
MKKTLLFLTALAMFTTYSYGQSYNSGIGVKGMNFGGGVLGGAGINYKTFIGGSNALDMTLGGGARHLSAQILYEWQRPTSVTDGLDWYIGAGGGLGIWSSRYDWDDDYYGGYYTSGFYLNATAVVGLDFNLNPNTGIPIGISLETGPSVGIINSRGFGWGGALAVRYIID